MSGQKTLISTLMFFSLLFFGMVIIDHSAFAQNNKKFVDIIKRQSSLTSRVEQLESKILRLIQFESVSDPARAAVLRKGLEISQSGEILDRSRQISKMLESNSIAELETVLENQKKQIANLNQLYSILESGDLLKSNKKQANKTKGFIIQITQLIQQQQGIRQRLNFGIVGSLKEEQLRIAAQTKDLQQQLNLNANQPAELDSKDHPISPVDEGPFDTSAKYLHQAEIKMNEAAGEIFENQLIRSAEKMELAHQLLGDARRVLQDELRQAREEEIETTLRALEDRFKAMLVSQLKINEQTEDLIEKKTQKATTRIEAFQLAESQRKLIQEIDKAIVVLQEEGTSRAIAGTLYHLKLDMADIVTLLENNNLDNEVVAIESEVAEILMELVASLETEQTQPEQMKAAQSGNSLSGTEIKRPLVQRIAELKIIRQLQMRINARHKTFANEINAQVSQTEIARFKAKIRALGKRQKQLEQMTFELIGQQEDQ